MRFISVDFLENIYFSIGLGLKVKKMKKVIKFKQKERRKPYIGLNTELGRNEAKKSLENIFKVKKHNFHTNFVADV